MNPGDVVMCLNDDNSYSGMGDKRTEKCLMVGKQYEIEAVEYGKPVDMVRLKGVPFEWRATRFGPGERILHRRKV